MFQDDTFERFLDKITEEMLSFSRKAERSQLDNEAFDKFIVNSLEAANSQYSKEFEELLNKYNIRLIMNKISQDLYKRLYNKQHYVKLFIEFNIIEVFVEGQRVVTEIPRVDQIIKKRFHVKLREKGFYLILFYLSSSDFYESMILYEILKNSFSKGD